ncbi:MAG: hypothetical protein WC937_02690 [Candidatus Omnitrophota bacterium]|jgi:hypothetical protein|nr:hypothetical protein [Candidatus Omnitrophota bacterium]MDD5519030.1 hypothetical protein [Candidatus Omnitrophota bacterium]
MGLNKDKKNTPILEYSVLAGIVIVFLLIVFQVKTGDINLCRAIFKDLTAGRYGVQKYIDWEHFQGLDVNVGITYSKFSTEQEKTGYKKAFIQSFSRGFKGAGGRFRAFINWRIYSKNNQQVVIAADYRSRNKTLLLALSNAGKKKLISLQWKK